jgi:hypothetical protein
LDILQNTDTHGVTALRYDKFMKLSKDVVVMKEESLKENLEEIENVSVTREGGALLVSTALPGYKARIRLAEVAGYQNLVSPHMQDCTRIDLKDGDFIIVPPVQCL